MTTLSEKIIEQLQSAHDSWIGKEGELSRQRFKDGLLRAIGTVETLTRIDDCKKKYEAEQLQNLNKTKRTKTAKQIAQMMKYQKWAHDNGLYSTISITLFPIGEVIQDRDLACDFSCQPKSYDNVRAFMKEFGIRKMDKDTFGDDGKKLEYETRIDGVRIHLYAISELGPRCKVVYEDVVVPATKEYVIEAMPEHTKKVAKIVCN